ncbi:hypothetical protein BH10ACI1_BH10ACI1_26580 [soil metagenome]
MSIANSEKAIAYMSKSVANSRYKNVTSTVMKYGFGNVLTSIILFSEAMIIHKCNFLQVKTFNFQNKIAGQMNKSVENYKKNHKIFIVCTDYY